MNPQIVTVNLIPGLSTPAVVRVSQYDVERPITFRVLDGNKAAVFPDDCTATIEATKPSGLGFSLLGTIAPGGMVSFTTGVAMTQECGMIPTEIRFSTNAYGSFPATDIGTANFILAVEPSPHPEGTTDGTQETMQNLETRLQGEIDALDSRIDAIEGDQSIIDDIDALDARVTALEQGGSGLSQTEKNLILTLFSKAAYAESDAETAYDQLEALWASSTKTITYNLSNVVSSNTQTSIESGQVYTTALAVRQNYTLNSVTVTMGGVDITSTAYSSGMITIPSVTGNLVITATAVLAAQSITATYTQSGTVYDTDSLDSLKADLVVTANYSGGTTEIISSSDYTLSGTLTVGTSTITVSYGGKTDTFDVTVSYAPAYTTDGLQGYWDFGTVSDGYFGDLTNLATNGNLTATALYQQNTGDNLPLAGFMNGEFLSTTSYISSQSYNVGHTLIRVSETENTPSFYTTYPYSVELYCKFVGGRYTGTTYNVAFAYATAVATAPCLFNTRNTSGLTTQAINVGGQGIVVTVQDGSYKSYGASGAGNNTFSQSNMTPESYHHYVVTVERASIKLYVDGQLIGEGTSNGNANASAGTGMFLGTYTSLKMARVYNKVLTASEVLNNYNDVISS